MEIKGEYKIAAPRDKVFAALNDQAILQACIPGCETLDKLSDTEMTAKVRLRIGPVSAAFSGKVTLSDIDPPNGYRISGEGQGGVAGFAKGGANVALKDDADGTLLSYVVNAQVGGKLAQLGGRLIDATAKQMADAFFDRFSKQVQGMAPATAEGMAPATAGGMTPATAETAAQQTMAEPVAVAVGAVSSPPSSISVWSLIPREPFGLPMAAWLGGGVFVIMVLLMLGSML
jgi:carbon monoxide dehydrogenase subunit G